MAKPWENDPLVEASGKGITAPLPWDNDPYIEEAGMEAAFPFTNKAIAGGLGAPVDPLAAAGINAAVTYPGFEITDPVGGSQSITRGMEALGIDVAGQEEQPEPYQSLSDRVLGEVGMAIIPMNKAMQVASKGKGLTAGYQER